MDVNFVDIELLFILIDNSDPFIVDIEFDNSGDSEIGRNVEKLGIYFGIDSKGIQGELASGCVVIDQQYEI